MQIKRRFEWECHWDYQMIPGFPSYMQIYRLYAYVPRQAFYTGPAIKFAIRINKQ